MREKEQFTKLVMLELRKHGYDCELKNDEIAVSKNGFPVLEILGGGDYRLHRNTASDEDYWRIRPIYESLSEAYGLYEKGEPLTFADLPQYRRLCEFANYIIAARTTQYGDMEYATWQQDSERTRVDIGHYFSDYEAARQDFAVRCGLIDRNKLFDETEMKLIRQGLVHLGANFPDLTYEQNTLLGKVVEKIEMLVPEIQEHEELERDELVADDELSL